MNKILMITPAFPPYEGSHTQRMVSIANSLVGDGFDVCVLTTEIMEGHPSYTINSSLHVDSRINTIRVPAGFIHKNVYSQTNSSGGPQKRFGIKKKVIRFANKIKRNLMIPDTMIDWYYAVKKYIKTNNTIESINPDIVYSCSMPNTCHLIGYYISKHYNITQIMDYGDPWVYITGYGHNKMRFMLEKAMEKKILANSKMVSFSANGCEKLYREKFQLNSKKTLTVLTGYDSSLIERSISYKSKSHKGILMSYGGVLKGSVRNPRPFFEALNRLGEKKRDLRFDIRTNDVTYIKDLTVEYLVDDCVNVKPYIPFEQYYDEMLESDILVFFGNSTTDQLPGKIFNYIASGKLMFYISNTEKLEEDQGALIAKEYGYSVIAKNNVEDISNGLEKAVKMLNQEHAVATSVQKYSTDAQMMLLVKKLGSL